MFSFVSFLGRLARGLVNFINVYKDPNFDFAGFLCCLCALVRHCSLVSLTPFLLVVYVNLLCFFPSLAMQGRIVDFKPFFHHEY